MALASYWTNLTDLFGNVLPSGEVEVRDTGGTLADLFEDEAGTTPADNPLNPDDSGLVEFYVAAGTYDLTYSIGAATSTTVRETIVDQDVAALRGDLASPGAGKGAELVAKGTLHVDSVSDLRARSFPPVVDHIWLDGYYGVGTAGGGMLYRDSDDDSTADNGGTVFVDDGGARWKRHDTGEWSVEQFGAQGGSTDDADEIQAAATAAENKTLVFEAEAYSTSKQIDFPSCHIVCRAGECRIDGSLITDAGDAPESCVLYFGGGGHTALPALNAAVSAADVTITFASAHGLSDGDYFGIYNPTDGSWNAARDAYHAGEWCKVIRANSTPQVTVASPLFEGYAVADVDLYKIDVKRYSFSGRLRVDVGSSNLAFLRGIRMRRVVDTDISGLASRVDRGHSGISLSQCINIQGTSVIGEQHGDSSSNLDYGMSVGNCQHVDITGYFSSRRHGVTHGGGNEIGAVPCRDSKIRGTIATNGGGESTLAADWHGNCEYCEFHGTILGGVNYGGNRNTVRGTVYANENGIVAYGGEVKGLDFDFSGVRFVSKVDVSASGRGCFDLGGNSTSLGSDATEGGVIDLSNTKWYVPEVANKIVSANNRGYTGGDPIGLSLHGAVVEKSNASVSNLVQIASISGDNWSFLHLEDIVTDRSMSSSVADVDKIYGPSEDGVETITTDTGAVSVDVSITFDREFPVTPSVVTSPNEPTSGSSTKLISYASNVNTTGFTLRLSTADATNFASALDRDVSWHARTPTVQ